MTDRVPLQLAPNGALRYGIYDSNGTLLRYEYIKLEDGATVLGTVLNKANLLSDTTAAVLKLSGDPTIDRALYMAFVMNTDWQLIQSYMSSGTFTWTAPDIYNNGQPYEVGVFIIGAGGSGSALSDGYNGPSILACTGGASGYTKALRMTVTPGNAYNVVVGSGGLARTTTNDLVAGAAGGSSSFSGVAVNGGSGGVCNISTNNDNSFGIDGVAGGQGTDAACTNMPATAPAMGEIRGDYYSAALTAVIKFGASMPMMCLNPFNGKKYLGAGGNVVIYGGSSIVKQSMKTLDDGLSAGYGNGIYATVSTAISAGNATSPGSGGGAVARHFPGFSFSDSITSGTGAPGAVMIYARKV